MTRHTPPRPVDVAALFPELVPFRREALRLHPRAGNPTHRESSFGGPLLWPAEEAWPECADADAHVDLGNGAPDGTATPLVPVLQIHRADAPGVPFPDGTDLLQVLWCPFDHDPQYCPSPVVRRRAAEAVGEVRAAPPAPAGAMEEYLPSPCVLHPERVTEYPDADLPGDLRRALRERLDLLERETGLEYGSDLASAPGVKLGGYPGWTQAPQWPGCDTCGRPMDHLLTVASWEYDGVWSSWIPLEDRSAAEGGREDFRDERSLSVREPAGLMLGDAGGIYLFECRACPERPAAHRFDCS
ncbi:DUF1963 domain-containing protein [Streptomyces abyssomicinicus]|uniref:DUF1963 domain-containing protein n=1 Tax=Streptomyces abyssomicinicus TaxID=574929 RepID=UPI0012500F87|nr:DUF1963 domain-containing protein [Streptomyces abyssomicinicus]